jgi:hypothetical protein
MFSVGPRRERPDVHAARSLPWSTGPVEGHIARLERIKRRAMVAPSSTSSNAASFGLPDETVVGSAAVQSQVRVIVEATSRIREACVLACVSTL